MEEQGWQDAQGTRSRLTDACSRRGFAARLKRGVRQRPNLHSFGDRLQDVLTFLISRAPAWIQTERSNHRPAARPLAITEVDALEPFFPIETLTIVRLASVPIIQNPPFYRELEQAGIGLPLDFRQMTGITFVDTVLISQAEPLPASEWLPLLFHELIHVLQYQELGLERFVRLYVLGWAAVNFTYEHIPLERDAYDLDAKFRSAPAQPFDALTVVRQRLSGYAAV